MGGIGREREGGEEIRQGRGSEVREGKVRREDGGEGK